MMSTSKRRASPTPPPVFHVQSVGVNQSTGGGSVSVSLPGITLTAGNLVVVAVSGSGASAPTLAVTDTLGNVYVSAKRQTTGTLAVEVFYCANCLGGAATISISQNPGSVTSASASEYTGPSISSIAIDGTSSSTAAATTISCTGPTVSTPPEFIFAVAGTLGNPLLIAGTAGWSSRYQVNAPVGFQSQDYLLAPSSLTATWTMTISSTAAAVMVSFK